jgi:hypothetical protein
MKLIGLAIVSGLCAAPLFYLVGAGLTVQVYGMGGGSDRSTATGYLSVIIGIVAALAGSVATALLVGTCVSPPTSRYVWIADGLVVLGLLWVASTFRTTDMQYEAMHPSLDIEVRVPKSANTSQQIARGVSFCLAGGKEMIGAQPLTVREEADWYVVSEEMVPIRVKDWAVIAVIGDERFWFPLPFRRRPRQSLPWSEWTSAATKPGYAMPSGLSFRCRFRLTNYGER